MKLFCSLFVCFSVTFVFVLGGRISDDTITVDHAYYTMSLFQVLAPRTPLTKVYIALNDLRL